MKRFWKEVNVEAGEIRLDGRPVRTPGRTPLVLPPTLAGAVAEEWRAVSETLDPRAMPLTGLANAAIDRIAPDPTAFAAGLARYGENDLLCYRGETPDALVDRQTELWDPPLAWARARYDVAFTVVTGIIYQPQPAATLARLREAIAARPPLALAPLSPIVTLTGSLVLALALAEGTMDADAVWRAAECDEAWQAEQWGDEPLAAQAREARRGEYDAAARFLALALR
jgi:chaperone required for assembly of F1-ATPase